MSLLAQALYSGVLVAAAYALIALGLGLVFGTMRIINMAHGELILLAAYLAYAGEASLGIPPLLAVPLSAGAVVALSLGVYALVDRIRQDREVGSLLLTYAVAVILTNGILMAWRGDVRSTNDAWLTAPFTFGDSLFSMRGEVLCFALGAALAAGVRAWLLRSWSGRAVRAVASNRDAARLMGIHPGRVEATSFALAGALAAVAGTALYATRSITPFIGHDLTIKAFVVVVLAGVGSVGGIVLGSALIAVAETLTVTFLSPSLQPLVAMLVFLGVLLLRPSGLFGARLEVAR